MNIVVLVKLVPDSEARLEVRPDGSDLDIEEKYELNYFDELAVEEALRIKESMGSGKVTVITLGTRRSLEALRKGIAMGADEAVHLDDPSLEGGDGMATARALAKAIQRLDYELVLCGLKATDDDSGEVGPMVAEFLGIPHVTSATRIEFPEGKAYALVERQLDWGREVVRSPLPVLITAQKGLNVPRVPSIQGVMKGMRAKPKVLGRADLGLPDEEVGHGGSQVEPIRYLPPPRRPAVKIIDGKDPAEKVEKLIGILRDELRII